MRAHDASRLEGAADDALAMRSGVGPDKLAINVMVPPFGANSRRAVTRGLPAPSVRQREILPSPHRTDVVDAKRRGSLLMP